MTGPAPTLRTRMMVEAYEAGATLSEVGQLYGVSKQRVASIVKRHAPTAMRPRGETRSPSVGPPGHELYRQGKCKTCEVSLWGYRPEPREFCGHCEALAKAAA